MTISKIIILSIGVLISLATIIMMPKLLFRKIRNKNSEEGKLKLSYGIWFATLFLSGSLIMGKGIFIFNEAIDNIYKTSLSVSLLELLKKGSLFIGLGIIWLMIWYYIINILSIIIMGKRDEVKEIEIDNCSYFLVRGILLIGFIICLLPVFEIILRTFMPSVQIPFYH
jgi:hypothetical protein